MTDHHLRLILESARDYAILATDPAGIITSWSAGAENVFGFPRSEILGVTGDILWTPEDLEHGGPAHERETALVTGVAEDRRWHLRKGGGRFFADGMMRPMRDEAGGLLGFVKICRDITSGKQAEEELAKARAEIAGTIAAERERLREFFQRSPGFLAVLAEPDHRFEMANEQYFRLIGRRDIIGKTIREALPEIEGQGFIKLLDQVFETGEPYEGKASRVILQDGPDGKPYERILDFVFQPTRDSSGKVTGIFVHGVDLTERELAQAAMQRLASIVDSSEDAIIGTDLNSTVISWNGGAERIFGFSAAEMIGTSIRRFVPADRQEEEDRIIRRISQGVRNDHLETRRMTKDGRALDVSVTISPIRDREGTIIGVSKVARDISGRKRAQEALRKSEALFRELADSMPNIVWASRPDGFIDYYNGRWYEFTGALEGSLGDSSWEPIVHPEETERVHRLWSHSLRTGEPYEIEIRYRRAADGAYRWHLCRALPVRGTDGQIVRWFGTSTDIHDHKLLQQENEQLLESERNARADAERSGRVKDEFLATLSHELRTPLHAIRGWTQVLTTGRADPAIIAQGIEVIDRNARAQTRIIEDLLDMSAIISGKVRLNVCPADLAPIIEAAVETVRPAAAAKGVLIKLALAGNVTPVTADSDRLQQVFWNLLSNAVKFTPRGGKVEVLLDQTDTHVHVAVLDTGEGIKPDFLAHVFARFQQADASSTRKHGGLGLGLAIVKQLVELHGGKVAVASPGPGLGSTFTVSLPLSASPASQEIAPGNGKNGRDHHPHESAQQDLRLKGIRVLIVDDEPDARMLVCRMLEEHEVSVRTAASAAEALSLIREDPPDVLVSDIGMPEEDGYSLIRRVRQLDSDKGRRVPAIALTAYARPEDRKRTAAAGFQVHLSKPVEGPGLLTMIARLAARPPGND